MFEYDFFVIVFLVLGICLLIAEVLTVSFYALFVAIGCLLISLFLSLKISFFISLCSGAFLAIVCIVIFQRLFQKKNLQTHAQKSPFENLIGEKGVLSEAIEDSEGYGIALIAGTAWRAKANSAIEMGAEVVVTGLSSEESTTVIVKKLTSLN